MTLKSQFSPCQAQGVQATACERPLVLPGCCGPCGHSDAATSHRRSDAVLAPGRCRVPWAILIGCYRFSRLILFFSIVPSAFAPSNTSNYLLP